MLLTITTTGKVVLLIVAGAFIAWAFVTAVFIPRKSRGFPRNVSTFVTFSALFFAAQMAAVWWVTSTQEVEAAAAETTPAETTPAATTTTPTTTTTETTTTTTTDTGASGGAGDAAAGKQVFASAGCAACHTLADAGASGTVGPNLDDKKPPYDLVVTRVTNGKGVMPSFKGQLSEQQIQDVAAYVSSAAGS